MSDYKVKAWSWCTEWCNNKHVSPFDEYWWSKALLEYRRENGIFEVGDIVTHEAYNWKILKVHDQIVDEGILFAKTNDHVKHHWGHGLVFDSKYVVCVSYSGCRHATDEEIKAGKRLP